MSVLFTFTVCGQGKEAKLLVLNKGDNSLAILDPQSLKVLGRVGTGNSPHEVAASADGRFAYVANYGPGPEPGNSLSIIDLAAMKEVRRVDLGALRRPHGIVVSGGKVYFTCETNRVIARYDPAADKVDWVMGSGQDTTHMLAVTGDQKKIYTANIRSASITVFDFSVQPSTISQISIEPNPEGMDLAVDGKEVWAAHRNSGLISIIETATKKVTTMNVGGDPYRVKLTPDGKRALISNPKDGELIVIDAATRKEVKRIPVEGMPAGITVTADGSRAFVTLIQGDGVAAINLESLSFIGKADTGKGPDGIVWVGQ
jgi:YVTN family beta-propeller protein